VDERIEWGGQPSTGNESAVNEGRNRLSIVNAVARPMPRIEGGAHPVGARPDAVTACRVNSNTSLKRAPGSALRRYVPSNSGTRVGNGRFSPSPPSHRSPRGVRFGSTLEAQNRPGGHHVDVRSTSERRCSMIESTADDRHPSGRRHDASSQSSTPDASYRRLQKPRSVGRLMLLTQRSSLNRILP
jgi:hypothetical protein